MCVNVCCFPYDFRSRTSQIIITSVRENSQQTIAERFYGKSSSYDWWFHDRLDFDDPPEPLFTHPKDKQKKSPQKKL